MTNQKKAQRKWCYLEEEDLARLDKLARKVGLNDAMVLSVLASAGLKACESIGSRLPLPITFTVSDTVPETVAPALNEPHQRYRK